MMRSAIFLIGSCLVLFAGGIILGGKLPLPTAATIKEVQEGSRPVMRGILVLHDPATRQLIVRLPARYPELPPATAAIYYEEDATIEAWRMNVDHGVMSSVVKARSTALAQGDLVVAMRVEEKGGRITTPHLRFQPMPR